MMSIISKKLLYWIRKHWLLGHQREISSSILLPDFHKCLQCPLKTFAPKETHKFFCLRIDPTLRRKTQCFSKTEPITVTFCKTKPFTSIKIPYLLKYSDISVWQTLQLLICQLHETMWALLFKTNNPVS